MIVPHFMDEHAIDTHRQNFDTEFLKFAVFLSNCRDLGGSHKGKVARVKT